MAQIEKPQSKHVVERLVASAADFRWLLLGALALLILVIASSQSSLALLVQPLRLLLGGAYVLYVPGYCLAAALFPRRDDIDGIERTGLSLGLSIAWIPILVLVLDHLPWGLRLWPILLGEYGSIFLFMAVALWRRVLLPADDAYVPDMAWRPKSRWRAFSAGERRIYKLCAAALLVASLAAAWVFLVPAPNQFVTEFYILGAGGLAENYPRETAVGQDLSVTVGVTNRERESHTYRAEIWAIDTWTPDRRELVATIEPFTLAPEESMERPLTWQMPWAGDDQQVEFLLFANDGKDSQPYRQLRLWLDVTAYP